VDALPEPGSPRSTGSKRTRRKCSLHGVRLCSARFLVLVMVAGPQMMGRSNAEAQTTSRTTGAEKTPAGDVQNGKRIFAAQDCQKCHGNEGHGISQAQSENAGPRIAPPSKSLAAFISYVREPTGQMQPYGRTKVSDSELGDVYAFLRSVAQSPKGEISSTVSAPAGNAANGRSIYTSYGCYECHGHHGEGSLATGPRLSTTRLEFADFVEHVR
jgi:mono/diheme cytochrome c family protein